MIKSILFLLMMTSVANALVIDRCVLQSGGYDCLAWKDEQRVLIAHAKPMAQPLFYTKTVVVTAEEVTVTTGLPEVQAKAWLCDDSQEDCE